MLDSGMELERLAHKFVWSLGYLPRSRLRFSFEEVEEETSAVRFENASDLDVLGFRYDGYLHGERFLVDCKHEAEGILAQILRCKGLQHVFEIDDVLLLRSKIGAQHRAFADSQGIRLMKVADFVEMVSKYEDLGSFSGATFEKVIDLEGALPREFRREVMFPLENTLLVRDPFERVKKGVALLDTALKQIPSSEAQSGHISPRKWVVLRGFGTLVQSVVEVAGHLIDSPANQVKYDLQVRLTGDVEFKRTFLGKLQASSRLGGTGTKDAVPLADLAPTYTSHIYEGVRGAIRHSDKVQAFLRLYDVVLHEFILHDKPTDSAWAARAVGLNKTDAKQLGQWIQSLAGTLSSSPGAAEVLAPLM